MTGSAGPGAAGAFLPFSLRQSGTRPSVYLEVDIMEARIVDLRYRMKSVLEAPDRGEPVTVLYRGKAKARIVPIKMGQRSKLTDHPAFGMWKDRKDLADPVAWVRKQREPRFNLEDFRH